MSNSGRREKELLFIADEDDWAQMKEARRLTQELNTADRADFDKIRSIIRKLFGKSDETTFVNPPFYCDYGSNIEVGKNCFINYNCVILDNAKVKLGDNCLIAPNVAIYTAGHTLHPVAAKSELFIKMPCRMIVFQDPKKNIPIAQLDQAVYRSLQKTFSMALSAVRRQKVYGYDFPISIHTVKSGSAVRRRSHNRFSVQ